MNEDVSCRTKRQYATKSRAKRALKRLRRAGRRDLVIYQCWHCELFHLGHPPGKQTYLRPGDPPAMRALREAQQEEEGR